MWHFRVLGVPQEHYLILTNKVSKTIELKENQDLSG